MTVALVALANGAVAAPRGGVRVSEAVIRPAPKGLPSTAAYLTLTNDSARAVQLTGVECGCAASVTAHESRMAGGVMHMAPAVVVVPPHGAVRFGPGGLHLMVMGLRQSIAPGSHVTMRLAFDHAAPVTATFEAKR